MLPFLEAPADSERERLVGKSPETLSDTYTVPATLPPFLSQQALDYYVGEFTRTGIQPANNWCRHRQKLGEHVIPRWGDCPAARTFFDRRPRPVDQANFRDRPALSIPGPMR
jgi:hypothetical protein